MADERGKVFVGGGLEAGTVLAAYRGGLFPMRQGDGQLAWWSPTPRAIMTPARVHLSQSVRRARHHFTTTVDTAFKEVIEGCAERAEGEYHWITADIQSAFRHLHELGWAHSVETWTIATEAKPATLAGGLYGVAIGGLFSGESMFHRQPDASKVALAALMDILRADGGDGEDRLIDVQWLTPHMASLGAHEVSREEYLARLERALALPLPPAFQDQQRGALS
jgi:leucyl/phenylalanyl-tRNA--protein transferase